MNDCSCFLKNDNKITIPNINLLNIKREKSSSQLLVEAFKVLKTIK